MASTVRTNRRRRLRLAVAGAVVLTTLTAATAGAALPPTDGEAATAAPPQRAANPATGSAIGLSGTAGNSGTRAGGTDAKPRSLTPGFLLERGRYTTIEVPGATVETGAGGINNRGVIVGGARGGGRPDRSFRRDARPIHHIPLPRRPLHPRPEDQRSRPDHGLLQHHRRRPQGGPDRVPAGPRPLHQDRGRRRGHHHGGWH